MLPLPEGLRGQVPFFVALIPFVALPLAAALVLVFQFHRTDVNFSEFMAVLKSKQPTGGPGRLEFVEIELEPEEDNPRWIRPVPLSGPYRDDGGDQ